MLGDEMAVEPLVATLQNPVTPVDAVAEALAALWERYEARYAAGAQIAHAVKRAMGPVATQRLLDAIDQAAPDRLPAITRVLGWLRGPAVDRALTRLLGRASVRAQVIESLVRHGAPVVALLMEQLRAEDLDTRQAAAVALGRIGDRRATGALAEALNDPEVTIAAAGALARIGDPEAFEPLLARLGHGDAAVRTAAVAALNSIGHPDMPARIFDLLQSPSAAARESAVKIAGYFAYSDCVDRVLERCGDPVESVRRAAIEHAVLFDHPGVAPALVHALRADVPANRAAAAAALAHVPGQEAHRALRDALADDELWVRYFAARSVGAAGEAEDASALQALLMHEPDAPVRVAAVEALGRLGAPGTPTVLEPFTASAEPDVASAAIRALGHLQAEGVVGPLVALIGAPEAWRREAAAHALGEVGGQTAALTLQHTAARDPQPPVREAAVSELARIALRPDTGAARASDALVQLADAAPTRAAAIAALARLPVSRMTDLRVAFEQAGAERRCALVEVFGRMRRPDATRMLERALADPAGAVRAAAITELRRLGSSGATRTLLALAREDPDREVREAAMLAVARQPVGAGRDHEDRD
jgi:HEAT repeat protein